MTKTKTKDKDKDKDNAQPHPIAYLSLGSNLGDREAHLRDAIGRVADLGRVTATSSLYETEPVELIDQPLFLNCALILEARLMPQPLMRSLLDIEEAMGRVRREKKGPRLIDLDILLFGDEVVSSESLTIPHPAMQERRFVLEPLNEIAANVLHPLLKKTIRDLLDALPQGQSVNKLKLPGEVMAG